MIQKTLYLNAEKTVYIKAYLLDKIENLEFCNKRPAVLIFPGGGYEFCSDREAEPIAMQYLAEGFNAFLLYYSVNKKHPAPLVDAGYSMLKIRERASEFNIDEDKIAVVGFSAGGHLAGSIATMWGDLSLCETLRCKPEQIRPNAAILSYPVISGITNPHKGSFDVLLGKKADRASLSRLSLENRVTPKTPPIFLWHTADDDCVPASNSLVMAKACVSNKIPVELHLFDEGPHGLSECGKSTGWNEYFFRESCRTWIKLSVKFLQKYMKI